MNLIRCPRCGGKTRLKDGPQVALCGLCGARLERPLPGTSGRLESVTEGSLPQLLQMAGARPVLVECWAASSEAANHMESMLQELSAESHGRYAVVRLDVDQNPQAVAHYEITSVPSVLIFKNEKLVDRMAGVQLKQVLKVRLAALL